MRANSYPHYKDSGIEWLGKIPAHWEIQRLKNVVSIRNEKVFSIDSDKPYIGMENVESWTGRIIKTDLEVTGTADTFRGGDVLFGKLRPYLAKAILASTSGQCSSEFLVLKPKAVFGRFLHFLVLSDGFVSTVNSTTYGTKMPRANWETVSGIAIVLPEADEQSAIADFLDRETSKIGALIDRKKRLIELLQEKRTALISHAVTKGLDPNVPMKDSGIEWLGKIPAHWEVAPLKKWVIARPGAIKTGPFGSQLLSSEMQNGTVKVYDQRTVLDKDFASADNLISEEKYRTLAAFTVYPGDLLVTTRGTIGRCAVVPNNAERGILHPCLLRIQPDSKQIVVDFLSLLIQDSFLVQVQLALASNATTIDVIYGQTIGQVIIPRPPIIEQHRIVAWVKEKLEKLDRLINGVENAIKLLKEYRIALISAAVTGKINVRDE